MPLTATFHISLFYKDPGANTNKDVRFFFGRTVQTEAIKLSVSSSGSFGFKSGASKPYFIHSNIPNLNKASDRVTAVIEVVLHGENNRGS